MNFARIKCDICNDIFKVDFEDLYVEESMAHERNMGLEVFYTGAVDIECQECGNDIEVSYEATEYPIGVPNYSETRAEGGLVLEEFSRMDIEVYFEDDSYNFDEQSQLFVPEEKKIITNLHSGISALLLELNKKPENIYTIQPREFEELIAHIFRLNGFLVDLTKQTRDGGRDIIAIKSELDIKTKYLIECKRYAIDRPISVDIVRALYGVQASEGANKSVLATTSRFTEDAKKFANRKHTTEWAMDLRDINDIRTWITTAANLSSLSNR